MRWPFGPRGRQIPTAVSDEGPAPRADTELHRSPGLREALRHLQGTSPAILDLGAACAANVQFFSHFRCRLHIADLIRDLSSALGAEASDPGPDSVLAAYLPQPGQPFDLVLAWDVFNYVDPGLARDLASRLARVCRPGARLYAMVAAGEAMPGRFRTYGIVDHENLRYSTTTDEARAGQSYTPAAFERVLDGFRIEHSFVLRHGMREYVAVRRADLD